MPAWVCAMLLVGVLSVEAWAVPTSCDRLSLSAPPEYPPFSYTNEGGLNGAGIEIGQRMALEVGVPAQIVSHASWARVYQRHLDGQIDMVVALYRTPEREKSLYFIGTYAADRTILVAPKAKPLQFSRLQDLVPLMGAIVNGDSRGAKLDAFIRENLRVVKVHSFVNVESLLEAGRVDYALVGEFSPKVTAFDYRAENAKLYAVEPPLTQESVYISLSRQSPCSHMLERLQAAFGKVTSDENADLILRRHADKASGRAIRQN